MTAQSSSVQYYSARHYFRDQGDLRRDVQHMEYRYLEWHSDLTRTVLDPVADVGVPVTGI